MVLNLVISHTPSAIKEAVQEFLCFNVFSVLLSPMNDFMKRKSPWAKCFGLALVFEAATAVEL